MTERDILLEIVPTLAICIAIPVYMGIQRAPVSHFLFYAPLGGAALGTGDWIVHKRWVVLGFSEYIATLGFSFGWVAALGGSSYALATALLR